MIAKVPILTRIDLPLFLLGNELAIRAPGELPGQAEQVLSRIQQQLTVRGDKPPARRQALFAEARGMRMALMGRELDFPAAPPKPDYKRVDLHRLSAETFLAWLEDGVIPPGKRIPSHFEVVGEYFLEGAKHSFMAPNSKGLVLRQWPDAFIKLACTWGLFVAQVPHALGKKQIQRHSKRLGKASANIITNRLELAREAGMTGTLLRNVHRRDVKTYLMARGYLIGHIIELQRTGQIQAARYLETNLRSIIYRALANGQPDYARQVVRALPNIIQEIEDGIAQLKRNGHTDAATTLRNYASSIISHALKNAQWDYASAVIAALPLDRDEVGEVATIFRTHLGSHIYRALKHARGRRES